MALGAPTPLFQPCLTVRMNGIATCMDRGLYNQALFLDVQKVFDTVSHVLLLDKLEAYGIRGNALNLLASSLADWKQTCQVNVKQSGLRTISCGIPYCSILGPLFFLAYINDLPNCLKYSANTASKASRVGF